MIWKISTSTCSRWSGVSVARAGGAGWVDAFATLASGVGVAELVGVVVLVGVALSVGVTVAFDGPFERGVDVLVGVDVAGTFVAVGAGVGMGSMPVTSAVAHVS
jgi:hypothetical protein